MIDIPANWMEKIQNIDWSKVEASVKESIRKGYDAQHGYILATGCDLNVNVPLENMDAFMAAARKYGKLPIDPSTWE